MSDRYFKGWAKPGPLFNSAREGLPVVEEGESLDAISGAYRLFQLKGGHRFSTDDILTAWYGTISAPRASRVLDLGSGIGSVGMVAAWRLPAAQFVTVEAQPESVRLARKSAAYNEILDRYEIRLGDFRRESREAPVLGAGEKFDLILGSPPYFPEDAGVHADHPQKIACRFELRGDIAHYCLAASEHLAPGGFFSCVFPVQPEQQLMRVRVAAQKAGLVIVKWRPVCLKEGEAPLLGLFSMVAVDDLPEKYRISLQGKDGLPSGFQESPLTIRMRDGSIHPEYSAVKLSIGFPP